SSSPWTARSSQATSQQHPPAEEILNKRLGTVNAGLIVPRIEAKKFNKKIRCYFCRQRGHKALNCHLKKRAKSIQAKRRSGSDRAFRRKKDKRVQCFFCHQRGHKVLHCDLEKRAKRIQAQRGSGSATAYLYHTSLKVAVNQI